MSDFDEIDKDKYFTLFSQFEKELQSKPLNNINDRILIVDLLNTFIRSWSASPAMNDNGEHIGGLSGALYSIGNAIRLINATRCIIVGDGEDGTKRRRELYPDYKKKSRMKYNLNRAYDFKNDEEEARAMKLQLSRLIDYLRCLPVQFISVTGVEADDAIAHITTNVLNEANQSITIMSSDKDFLQLVTDRVSVWSPTKKKMYTPREVQEEYGVTANNFLFYKILMGDDSDNIPGVDGCGKVTIPKYLQLLSESSSHSVDEVMKYAEEQNSGKKKKKFYQHILESKDKILLNEKLMQLADVNISDKAKLTINQKLKDEIPPLNKYEIHLMYMHDGMSNAMSNINEWLLSTFSILNSFAVNRKQLGES